MVACKLLVPCGLTMDTLHFFFLSHFVFYVFFFYLLAWHTFPCFYLFINFSHTAQHTDDNILISFQPPFPPSLHLRYWFIFCGFHIEVEGVVHGVSSSSCSRLPFCVYQHAEPIRRLGTMKTLFHSFMLLIIGLEKLKDLYSTYMDRTERCTSHHDLQPSNIFNRQR